jgi:hypothetical protein
MPNGGCVISFVRQMKFGSKEEGIRGEERDKREGGIGKRRRMGDAGNRSRKEVEEERARKGEERDKKHKQRRVDLAAD